MNLLLALLWALGAADAVTPGEVATMVSRHVPDRVVVATVRGSGGFSETQLAELTGLGVPPELVAQLGTSSDLAADPLEALVGARMPCGTVAVMVVEGAPALTVDADGDCVIDVAAAGRRSVARDALLPVGTVLRRHGRLWWVRVSDSAWSWHRSTGQLRRVIDPSPPG